MKGELGGRILRTFVALRPKIYSYLADDGCVDCVDKRAKSREKCVIKRERKIDDYKAFLENNKTVLKTHQTFRSETDSEFTRKLNKITLSTYDGKRIQTFIESSHIRTTQVLEQFARQNFWNT